MSAQPFESRIAHIEGVNVQIADRLNGMDGRLIRSIDVSTRSERFDALAQSVRSEIGGVRSEVGGVRSEIDKFRSDMRAGFAQVDGRFSQIDQKFMWVIGINVTWTTAMTALLALLFRH